MESWEVLRDAIDRVGVKSVAAKLRVSSALVYKWCEHPSEADEEGSGARNPLDRLADVLELTNHVPLVNWLCQVAGGFFTHNPPVKRADFDADLLESTQRLVQEFSDLLREVSQSVANDGQISTGEAVRIRQHWEELKIATETFVVACERGIYRKSH